MPDSPLAWLFLDLNSYFASVEQQMDPRLRGRPVIVTPVESDATCAIAASYEAKALGIKTGTPVWEARKKCPGVITVAGKHQHYVEYHHKILKEIDNHIPVSKVCSIDEVACELMGSEKIEANAVALAKRIKQGIAANVGECLRSSIGIAPNRFLAKVATDLEKPDGLQVIRPEDLPGKLLKLKPRDIPGIGYNMEARLWKHRIFTMQDLWNIPPKHMRAIWGSVTGERMYYALRGVEVADEETTRSSIGHSHVMAPELRPLLQARLVARRLGQKVAARLRRIGYQAGAMVLSVRTEHREHWAAEVHFTPLADTLSLLKYVDLLWRGMVRETGFTRVMKIGVTLHRLQEMGKPEPDLFEVKEERARLQRLGRLSAAMDKINHRYGRDTMRVGEQPITVNQATGTKVAFTRIPDVEEFLE